MSERQARSVGVHSGPFHADEVTACSLLIVFGLVDKEKIVRTRDPSLLKKCQYVCDVGGIYDPTRLYFDHHQHEYEGPMSSAGMILLYLKEEGILPEDEYHYLNDTMIQAVDLDDNGIKGDELRGVCTFSDVILQFNPPHYNAKSQECDKYFFQALDFVVGHLERKLERHRRQLAAQEIVKKVMERDTECLYFDQAVPWLENFFLLGGQQHPARFVMMPNAQGWKLRGIPPNHEEEMSVRHPLPEEWAGLLDEELQKVSGIPGAIFCHKGRFISIWKTKEDAEKALNYTLNLKEV